MRLDAIFSCVSFSPSQTTKKLHPLRAASMCSMSAIGAGRCRAGSCCGWARLLRADAIARPSNGPLVINHCQKSGPDSSRRHLRQQKRPLPPCRPAGAGAAAARAVGSSPLSRDQLGANGSSPKNHQKTSEANGRWRSKMTWNVMQNWCNRAVVTSSGRPRTHYSRGLRDFRVMEDNCGVQLAAGSRCQMVALETGKRSGT